MLMNNASDLVSFGFFFGRVASVTLLESLSSLYIVLVFVFNSVLYTFYGNASVIVLFCLRDEDVNMALQGCFHLKNKLVRVQVANLLMKKL
jgi:hypothetical protein